MSDNPESDARKELRHSVRTSLNHVAGFAGLLCREAAEEHRNELSELYSNIETTALTLRDRAVPCFLATEEGGPSNRERSELERQSYGLLYDIIALVQTAKRRAGDDERYLADSEKILMAANRVVELFEDRPRMPGESDDESSDLIAPLDELVLSPTPRSGRILVVDDDQFNRDLLARHLERQGHVVCTATDGAGALALLRDAPFDIILLDVMMPGMNGYQLLARIKSDEKLRDIYVIIVSALDDTQSIARCIQLGAEDYLPREFEPVVLKARIESCLEKKGLKEKEALYIAAVTETERKLRSELQEGAAYVRGLLPPRLDRPGLRTDWVFVPSLSLGGDVFGYHDIGGEEGSGRFALYLLDVSGHGIEAALFSVTLMNMLKTQVLPDADFGNPSSVLTRLNESFRMEEQNNLYFTAWYGVWDPATRVLAFASAGSPPAVLVKSGGAIIELASGGMIVGLDESAIFPTETCVVERGARLYLFSDGIYEAKLDNGEILGLEAFERILEEGAARVPELFLASVVDEVRSKAQSHRFEDDVSMVEFCFD